MSHTHTHAHTEGGYIGPGYICANVNLQLSEARVQPFFKLSLVLGCTDVLNGFKVCENMQSDNLLELLVWFYFHTLW